MHDKGRLLRRRLSRRQLVTQAAGASLAGVTLVACSRNAQKRPAQGAAGPSGTQSTANTPRPGGAYNWLLSNNAVLDPQALSQAPTDLIASGGMSRPFRFKTGPDPSVIDNHDIESDLALSAESPDAVTWTVKLRPGAKFHDVAPVNGHAVEAEDVRATFVRALSLPQNPNRGALGMIDPSQIETPASDTVIFKLKYSYAPFRKTLASPNYSWIFPREALAGSYDPTKQLIGSGPFILESYTPDVAGVLKKNPNWFESASGRPYVDGVRLAIIPAVAQQLAQFTAGNLDEVSVKAGDLDQARRSNPKATVVRLQPNAIGTLYFQLGDPASVFQDVRIRRALSMAVDRDALATAVFDNQYVDSLFFPTNLGKWALKVNQLDATAAPYYKYNPTEAKRLLQEAGASNLSMKFAYYINGPGFGPRIDPEADAIRNMLNTVGVKTTDMPIDFLKDYLDAGKGYRQGYYPKDTILYGTNQQFTEIDEFLYGYYHSKSTQNEEHLNDSTLDTLIDKARTIVDDNERLKASLDIQKYIAGKMYVVTAGGAYGFTMVQPRVQNYNPGSFSGAVVETDAKLWLTP